MSTGSRLTIDFRSWINSLATIVEQSMGLSPFQRAVCAFCDRGRNRIKLLFYDVRSCRLLLNPHFL